MAGDPGEALHPLTRDRTRSALPFGAQYRIIDFALSNLVNSGFQRIYVFTRHGDRTLLEHLQRAWIRGSSRDSFITAVPASLREGQPWYEGTAAPLVQNLDLLARSASGVVALLDADHVFTMNLGQMLDHHRHAGAAASIAWAPLPVEEAGGYDVLEVTGDGRVTGVTENPERPTPMRERPGHACVSLGVCLVDAARLTDALRELATVPPSGHGTGRDLLPALVAGGRVHAYDFHQNRVPAVTLEEPAHWRDIGSVDAYYHANLDLKNVVPGLNLYNGRWPLRAAHHHDPPAKFVFDDPRRQGRAVQSVVGSGSIVAGGLVKDSILGRNVHVEEGAEVVESVLLDGVRVRRDARVRRAIVDENVTIDGGAHLEPGGDVPSDAHVTGSGVVVVPRAVVSSERRAWSL